MNSQENKAPPPLLLLQAEKSPDGHSRDEMAIAVALHHKHLIRMLGVLEEPLGLVMELVAGRPQAQKPNFEVGGPGDRGLMWVRMDLADER